MLSEIWGGTDPASGRWFLLDARLVAPSSCAHLVLSAALALHQPFLDRNCPSTRRLGAALTSGAGPLSGLWRGPGFIFHLFHVDGLTLFSSLSVFLKRALLRCWHSGFAVLSCSSLPSFHPVFTTTFSLRFSVARSVGVGFPDPGWRLIPHWGPCSHDVLGPFLFLFVCCATFMGCHLC